MEFDKYDLILTTAALMACLVMPAIFFILRNHLTEETPVENNSTVYLVPSHIRPSTGNYIHHIKKSANDGRIYGLVELTYPLNGRVWVSTMQALKA